MTSNGVRTVKTAVLYARVSGDEQAKRDYTLADHLDALRHWCSENDYEILELKDLRTEQALTQRERADKVGIGVNTVNRIELNETEPHMSTVRKLAAALGVEPRRLTKTEG